jgi:hypothetical protein
VPAESADTASSLEDYLDLLEGLSDLGVEFVVIGGCAVGAYSRLIGEAVFSRDLDLFDAGASPLPLRADARPATIIVGTPREG